MLRARCCAALACARRAHVWSCPLRTPLVCPLRSKTPGSRLAHLRALRLRSGRPGSQQAPCGVAAPRLSARLRHAALSSACRGGFASNALRRHERCCAARATARRPTPPRRGAAQPAMPAAPLAAAAPPRRRRRCGAHALSQLLTLLALLAPRGAAARPAATKTNLTIQHINALDPLAVCNDGSPGAARCACARGAGAPSLASAARRRTPRAPRAAAAVPGRPPLRRGAAVRRRLRAPARHCAPLQVAAAR
jgi:hypothetical protein